MVILSSLITNFLILDLESEEELPHLHLGLQVLELQEENHNFNDPTL
jgi:hypothetical protein